MTTLSTRIFPGISCCVLGWFCGGIAATPGIAAAADDRVYALSIEAQPLERSLQTFARQSGIQVVFFSAVTDGVDAPAVEGNYTLADAMDRLLGTSGLEMRMVNAQTVEIQRTPTNAHSGRRVASVDRAQRNPLPRSITAGSDRLEEVVVVGSAEQLVATRVPTPLLEIPQTVSIISREQLRQQNSTDLADALRNAAGVSVVRISSIDQNFLSRGLDVISFHIDGGAALVPRISGLKLFMQAPDLSEFEHIEVLRGADTLFSGNANPGGTVSMVRKRPLEYPRVALSLTGGSWDNHRAELDVTGPLSQDGALRGRVDAVYSRQNYFYDVAELERKKIFAVAEYDVSADATLTFGGGYQFDDSNPFIDGLPMRSDGTDPRLPRDTALMFDWTYYDTRVSEAYLQYRQQLRDGWALKVNALYGRSKIDIAVGGFNGLELIDPVTNGINSPADAGFTRTPNVHRQASADVTLTGVLDWFGLREEVALGADFLRYRAHLDVQDYFSIGPPAANVTAFDRSLYPDPRLSRTFNLGLFGVTTLDQYGAFASMRAYFNDAWSAIAGLRIGSDNVDTDITLYAPGLAFPAEAEFGSRRALTPYLGVVYTFGDRYSIYASYTDIYRSGLSRRRMDGSLLGPIHGINLELGLKGEWRDGALNGTLAVYDITQRNIPFEDRTTRRPPDLDVINCCYVGTIGRSKGLDLELNGELVPGWLIGGGYTYNVNDPVLKIRVPQQTPRHLLKLWTSTRLRGALDRWTVGGSLHAQSRTRNNTHFDCGPTACAELDFTQPAYATVDLRVGFQINPNWRVALSTNNVFDKRYYDSIGQPSMHVWYGEPRNYMVRVDSEY
jgi:outer-membrane receptor for ferric coprogen and ferric-rhodotorulic acid